MRDRRAARHRDVAEQQRVDEGQWHAGAPLGGDRHAAHQGQDGVAAVASDRERFEQTVLPGGGHAGRAEHPVLHFDGRGDGLAVVEGVGGQRTRPVGRGPSCGHLDRTEPRRRCFDRRRGKRSLLVFRLGLGLRGGEQGGEHRSDQRTALYSVDHVPVSMADVVGLRGAARIAEPGAGTYPARSAWHTLAAHPSAPRPPHFGDLA